MSSPQSDRLGPAQGVKIAMIAAHRVFLALRLFLSVGSRFSLRSVEVKLTGLDMKLHSKFTSPPLPCSLACLHREREKVAAELFRFR